jgi:hypothetical protein
MAQSTKRLLNQLYSQCDDLASYSHHLTEAQCDAAFRWVRDIVLYIKTGTEDEYEYDNAVFAATRLDQLVNLAKNGSNEPCA